MTFSGSCVALVTPFKNGKVDHDKLAQLVEFHIKNKTSALVPCGTTGESATLTFEEHHQVIETVVEVCASRIPVIAGTGSNNTSEALELTAYASKIGADAALIITPYYNRPTQAGLYHHYRKIADGVSIPVIVYNVPSRTGTNILPATVVRLAKDCPNIKGIKEASGSLDQVTEIIAGTGADFSVLSGDDSMTLPMLSLGARGVISVVANIVPGKTAELVSSFFASDLDRSRAIHIELYELVKAMFIETNPIPVKTAMEMMGLCDGTLRLPLFQMEESNKKKLRSVLEKYGLL